MRARHGSQARVEQGFFPVLHQPHLCAHGIHEAVAFELRGDDLIASAFGSAAARLVNCSLQGREARHHQALELLCAGDLPGTVRDERGELVELGLEPFHRIEIGTEHDLVARDDVAARARFSILERRQCALEGELYLLGVLYVRRGRVQRLDLRQRHPPGDGDRDEGDCAKGPAASGSVHQASPLRVDELTDPCSAALRIRRACRWAASPRQTLINGEGLQVLRVDPAAVHLAAQSHGHLDAGDRAFLDLLGLDDPDLCHVFCVLVDHEREPAFVAGLRRGNVHVLLHRLGRTQ